MEQKRCYQYRRSIMFLCRLVLFGAMVGLFVLIWDLSYKQTRFYYKGNFVVVLIYSAIYLFFNEMYGGFKIGGARHGEVLYSNAVALVFTDALAYLQLSLIGMRLLELAPMLLLWILQFCASALLTYAANAIYFKVYPVREVLIVCRTLESEQRLTRQVRSIREKYKLKQVIVQERGVQEIKQAILSVNCVMITDIDLNLRRELVDFCYEHDTRVYVVPNVEDIMLNTAESTRIFDTPVLLCRNYQLTHEQRMVKRMVDLLFSVIGLVLTSPVMLLEALSIKLYDGGPVFYRQKRLTDGNRIFEVLKFRSMAVDAEADGVARLAKKNDSRVTPVGRFIRATRLDELPQLINVLRGDMSLVGPRPERPELAEKNAAVMPEFKYRTKVRAGLTGYAQVYGKYNTTPEDKLKMDLIYIERYSILLDLKLIFLTFKILFQPGATEGVE